MAAQITHGSPTPILRDAHDDVPEDLLISPRLRPTMNGGFPGRAAMLDMLEGAFAP
jgi:hypothetical protein